MPVSALGVIDDAGAAVVALHPVRSRILELLAEPDSAAGVARRLGLPRQKVNYHVRQLESAGLLEFVKARRAGNRSERLLRATASSWVIAPGALGAAGADPRAMPADASSSAQQVALAARTIQELSVQRARAAAAGRPVPGATRDAEVRFASAAAQEAFSADLASAIDHVIAKHHDAGVPGGRTFRVVVGVYPKPGGPT
ncbi:MAG: helix-turn-helix domain-containing protein [Gemmatimonadetes bacterium]|nr:helix-turn-helix domain-containing protein [Gemmatimonadota bacterium]